MFLHLQEWTKAEASALPVNVLRKVQCAWLSVTESEFILSVVCGGGRRASASQPLVWHESVWPCGCGAGLEGANPSPGVMSLKPEPA